MFVVCISNIFFSDRASIRLVLLFYFQQGLTRRNYLEPLNRSKEHAIYKSKLTEQSKSTIEEVIEEQPKSQTKSNDDVDEGISSTRASSVDGPDQGGGGGGMPESPEEIENSTFRLSSSGRVLRNIENAPAKSERMWLTPSQAIKLRKLVQVSINSFEANYL